MPDSSAGRPTLRHCTLALGLVAVVTAGCGGNGSAAGHRTSAVRPGWSAVPGQVAVDQPGSTAPAVSYGDPVALSIPSIGVRTPLERLSTDAQGELLPPQDPDHAGWFAAGVRPGEPGPAVIAGHVDSRTGPAVFVRLGELRTGATVDVREERGSVRFVVDAVRSYPKDRFPTAAVYGGTPDPQLRLITCGGAFDQQAGHYLANIVVFAHRTP